jgi:hypothetical protein
VRLLAAPRVRLVGASPLGHTVLSVVERPLRPRRRGSSLAKSLVNDECGRIVNSSDRRRPVSKQGTRDDRVVQCLRVPSRHGWKRAAARSVPPPRFPQSVENTVENRHRGPNRGKTRDFRPVSRWRSLPTRGFSAPAGESSGISPSI